MNTNEQNNIPLKPFMAVAMAPVVVFALANVMFLPLVEAIANFSDSILADLVASTNNPFIQDFILIIVGMFFLPLSAIAVLIGPALTSFLVNLKFPILTNRSRAIWSGVVFLFFHIIFLMILLIFRFMNTRPSIYSPFIFLSFFDPLPCLGFLAGIMLSCSVAIAGRFGAQKGSVRNKRTGSV